MSVRASPLLQGLLLRLRHAQAEAVGLAVPLSAARDHQHHLLPAFVIGGAAAAGGGAVHQQQHRAKRTVRVVLKRDDAVAGARAGDVVRVPAGRQRLDLFPSGAADYATPRAVREARASAATAERQQARPSSPAEQGDHQRDAAVDDDDEASSLQRAIEALESKPVVLRRRGKQDGAAAAATTAAAADAAGDDDDGVRVVGRGVTPADVARAVERQLGVAIDERLLLMGGPIRAFGEYRVPLNVAAAGAGAGASSSGGDAAAGKGRRQAHLRVEVVRTWR